MKKLSSLILFMILILSYSCNPKIDREYIKSLHPTSIPHSQFEISIPGNYSLVESQGPDFNVYYLQPTDTTDKKLFSVGIYLGNNPSAFGKTKSGCKQEKRKAEVLGTKNEWSVYDCNGQYFLETIVENKYHQGGDDFIHVFGNAANEKDAGHIIAICSTLIKKK
jgi:hypothetical protein